MKAHVLLFIPILFLTTTTAQIINFPDANFKAKLLEASATISFGIASIQTPDANGNVSSFNTIDTNGDGEIQISEANAIQYLNISYAGITNLEGINNFTNLVFLNCSVNQLTSIDDSVLNNLQFLNCSNNQIPSLDVNSLSSLTKLECSFNQLQSITLIGLTNLTYLDCRSNQLSSINVNGLINLNALYCGSNQLQDLDLSGLVNLQILMCEFNQLNSIDVSGLISLQQLFCYDNLLSVLDVSGLTNIAIIECSNNQLESIFIKNINEFWLLYFDNNPNLQYICADDQNLSLVQQKINEYGYAATCTVNSYCSFTPGGVYYIVEGNNTIDENANGCDASDAFYPNLKFSITDGIVTGNLISNTSGNYSIPVLDGTHSLAPQLENPTYFTVSPASTTVSFPASTSPFVQDFCITPNGVHHDLEVIVIPIDAARPGFDATYKIKYKNKGTVSETATLVFNFNEAVLDFVDATVVPTLVNSGSLSWTIGPITPFQSGEFIVTLNVNSPMETPAVNAGDLLSYMAVVNGLNTDETIEDNTFTLRQTAVNSYDPNDKTCLEGNTISPTRIGEYVHYQIRFENTGTFPAQNIVVKDLIDTTVFDVSTLQMTDTSHSCVTRITNPNQVEFIFENINLPFDDANNDGYLVFKIKTKSTLVTGSTISNLANIYFDYNFPITTNTATSTFQTLQNESFELDAYLTMYPNPVAEILNLKPKTSTEIYSLTIYNLLGQQVQTVINPNESIDVSRLTTGSYIVKITTDKGILSSKFIKE
jgi:uncharacterized repeat protein (TIGR01451 family)